MGGGDSTKVETAKRRRQNQNETRGKAAEVHLAARISVKHREEVQEKVQRKMRYLLRNTQHRLREEEMEEQFNDEAKEGWRNH